MTEVCLIDSNVIVRLMIADVADQFEKARDFFKKVESGSKVGKISVLVVDEVIWVLENYYALPRELYLPQILKILAIKNVRVMEVKKSLVQDILKEMMKSQIDFTDYYLARNTDGIAVFSFDKDLEKLAKVGSVRQEV